MKGRTTRGTLASSTNVRGQLLGHNVTTRPAMPTSAKAIGPQVSALLKPLQEGKGAAAQFVSPALLAAWPEIVGERLAGLCMPVQMKAKPKSRSRHKKPGDDGAVLEVRADPSIKIDLDYGQALLVERINAFFGYCAVANLKVLAKPMAQAADALNDDGSAVPNPPSPQAIETAHAAAAAIEDDALRGALEKLGAAVLSQSPPKP